MPVLLLLDTIITAILHIKRLRQTDVKQHVQCHLKDETRFLTQEL